MNVGQAPQSSLTVNLTIIAPGALRLIVKKVWKVPGTFVAVIGAGPEGYRGTSRIARWLSVN
jgi:hypothetical protein